VEPTDDEVGNRVMGWMARQPQLSEPPPPVPCREEKWISPEAIDRLFSALEDGPMTVNQLVALTGYSHSHVGMLLRWFVLEGDVIRDRNTYPRIYRLSDAG
jgi:hypothetical protein